MGKAIKQSSLTGRIKAWQWEVPGFIPLEDGVAPFREEGDADTANSTNAVANLMMLSEKSKGFL